MIVSAGQNDQQLRRQSSATIPPSETFKMQKISPRSNSSKTSPRSRTWWPKRGSEDSSAGAETKKPMRPQRPSRRATTSPKKNSPSYSPLSDPKVLNFLGTSGYMCATDMPMGVQGQHPAIHHVHNHNLLPETSRWRKVSAPPAKEPVEGLGLTSDAPASRPKPKKSLSMPKVKMPFIKASPPLRTSKSQPEQKVEKVEKNDKVDKIPNIKRQMSDLDALTKHYQDMMEVRGHKKSLPSIPTEMPSPLNEPSPVLLQPKTFERRGTQYCKPLLQSNAIQEIEDESAFHPLKAHPWNYIYAPTALPQTAEFSSSDESDSNASSPKSFSTPSLSPRSDGTLVAFEEDAIYFKPFSFGPSPPNTPPTQFCPEGKFESLDARFDSIDAKFESEQAPPTSPIVGLGLLAQDMVCSLADASPRTDNKFTKVQITVMIETYERLQDQVGRMSLDKSESSNAKSVFDCWISALKSIRSAMGDDAMDDDGANWI